MFFDLIKDHGDAFIRLTEIKIHYEEKNIDIGKGLADKSSSRGNRGRRGHNQAKVEVIKGLEFSYKYWVTEDENGKQKRQIKDGQSVLIFDSNCNSKEFQDDLTIRERICKKCVSRARRNV